MEKKLGAASWGGSEDWEDAYDGVYRDDAGAAGGDCVRKGQGTGLETGAAAVKDRYLGPAVWKTAPLFAVTSASTTTTTHARMSKQTVFIVTGGIRCRFTYQAEGAD